MIPRKLYMPQIYIIALVGLSFLIPAYADITIQNADFEFNDFNLNVTSSITVESLAVENDGFTTNNGELLRKYYFDNATSIYNVHWDSIDSEKAQYTITDVITDARGTVNGTELADIELDDVSVSWIFAGSINTVSIDEADKVEYFFTGTTTTTTPNAIVIYLNPSKNTTLGGVYALICPTNSTLTGLFTNGTFICTDLGDFFP